MQFGNTQRDEHVKIFDGSISLIAVSAASRSSSTVPERRFQEPDQGIVNTLSQGSPERHPAEVAPFDRCIFDEFLHHVGREIRPALKDNAYSFVTFGLEGV